MSLAPDLGPEVFVLSDIVCVFVLCTYLCQLHHDRVVLPINLSIAFFSWLPTFITHLLSMSDHLGEKKLSYSPHTITVLAH